MNKYRFEICYQPEYMKKASDLLKTFDLGFEEVALKETITFRSSTTKSIEEIKESLKKAFKCGNCEILHIEGGKIE
jgi:hypothetical protein